MAVIVFAGSQNIETVQRSPTPRPQPLLAGDRNIIHGLSGRVVSKKNHAASLGASSGARRGHAKVDLK
jgi:hypothetical protein